MNPGPKTISVRHSGTRRFNEWWNKYGPNHAHVQDTRMELIRRWLDSDEKIMGPFRHPARIWESWKRRDHGDGSYSYGLFYKEVENLIECYNSGAKIILVDGPNREQRLKELEEWRGLKCEPNFGLYQSRYGTAVLPITEELLQPIPKEFIEFYNDLI